MKGKKYSVKLYIMQDQIIVDVALVASPTLLLRMLLMSYVCRAYEGEQVGGALQKRTFQQKKYKQAQIVQAQHF